MNTQTKPNKETYRNLFMQIINTEVEIDHRSLFDQKVPQEELRKKLFSDESEVYKNNPAYKLRTDQLRTNQDTLSQLRTDMAEGLLVGSAGAEITGEESLVNIAHFSKYNPIGEDFIVETQMINVGCSNSNKTPIMMRGFGFMYLVDCISGRKIYMGMLVNEKKKADERPQINVYVDIPVFDTIVNYIEPADIISWFVGKDFSGLRSSLLKHTTKFRIAVKGYKTDTAVGRAARHKKLVAVLKALSPHAIDFIRLSDLSKVMFKPE